MLKFLKDTVKHSFIYGLGNIASKLIGFVLLPLYTAHLSPSEYGILAIVEVLGQILVSVFSFNISTAMMRWAADAKDERDRKSIIFTSLSFTLVIAVLLPVILIPFSGNFSLLFFDSSKFGNYFMLLFLTSSLGIYNLIPLTIMRLRERSGIFAILNTIKFTITLLLNVYFIAYKGYGITGILLSLLIGQLFLTIFSLPIVVKNIIPKFKFSILREMLLYGVPLVFSTIFTLVFTMGDRFVIKSISGDASVGFYSLGHKIASVINVLILQSFQLGFLPIAYKKLGDADEKKFFSKVLTYYVLLLIFAALGLSLFGKEVLKTFALNKAYWVAYSVIPIISLAFVFKGIQYNFSLSFHYSKKTAYNALIVIITAFINVVLNIFLVGKYNFVGAAYAMLLSFIIMTILTYYFGRRVYPIDFEIMKIVKIIIAGLLLFAATLLIPDNSTLILRIFLKSVVLLVYPFLLLFLGVFTKSEIDFLVNKIKLKKAG